jgi:Flp pilus assembly protein TadB
MLGALTAALVLVIGVGLRPHAARAPAGDIRDPLTRPSLNGRLARRRRSARRSGGVLERRRRRREVERAWPDAIELLVHALEAGLTPRQAVVHLTSCAPLPVRAGFVAVVHRTERGQPFADARRALPEQLGPATASVADVIATSERYGLPLAPVLDQLARDARDARRRLDQAAARTLPVRLSFPLVVCTLPSFVLLAIAPAVIAALSSLGGVAW